MDELPLHLPLAGLLHSVWVVFNTVECVAGHVLTNLVKLLGFLEETVALMEAMWTVCL